jgi:hypothetical protein
MKVLKASVSLLIDFLILFRLSPYKSNLILYNGTIPGNVIVQDDKTILFNQNQDNLSKNYFGSIF